MSSSIAEKALKTVREVYRGYMPIDLPQHRPPNKIKPWWRIIGKPKYTIVPKKPLEGYSDQADYPPLNDASVKGLRAQVRLDWYESLKAIPTAEAKMHEIGKHCEHYIAHINNWMPNYNSLPMAQYLTRTRLLEELPKSYQNSFSQFADSETLNRVKKIITDHVSLYKYGYIKGNPGFVSKSTRDPVRNRHNSDLFVQNLVSSLRTYLAIGANPELLNYQCDLSPAIRSWWYHSGLPPPNSKIFYKVRKDDDGNINQMIQMSCSSALNYRCNNLIEPIVTMNDPLVTNTSTLKSLPNSLRLYGATYKFSKPVSLAGFWPHIDEEFNFPHTCFLTTDCLAGRNLRIWDKVRSLDDDENALNVQAIMTAFGWLNSLSMYHGFTPFQELEYPFTCQVVTTNGQNWLFNIYQMNTHAFHRDLELEKRNNICWSSGIMKLYEDYRDGEFIGLNDEVISTLIRFLAQKSSPEYTSQLNTHPYLGADERSEENVTAMRKNLRDQFEQRRTKFLRQKWKVPLFEHVFFRSKVGRNRIKHMKPQYHIPTPKYPKIFE